MQPDNVLQRVPGHSYSVILDTEAAWQCFIRIPAEIYASCNLSVDSLYLPLVMRTENSRMIEEVFSRFINESANLDYRHLMSQVILLLTDIWGHCKHKYVGTKSRRLGDPGD
ncbi:MAG: hypothetical protein MK132_24900 [Lentisphaerales bacterium]|nr:hypothetical protein [Lentisphaerales bacterium]